MKDIKGKIDFLAAYLKQYIGLFIIFALFSLIFMIVFALYHLPVKAVIYPTLVCTVIGIFISAKKMILSYQTHKKLVRISKMDVELTAVMLPNISKISAVSENDYQNIIKAMLEREKILSDSMEQRYNDMVDYYTLWAHQIKTPIASMKLRLQNEDSTLSRKLSIDLTRIEQYVEMVLMFLRIDAASTDYLIREYELDEIIRTALRKFSGEFILKKLSLVYTPVNLRVVTDEKWLTFVIEQLISNALKYTTSGAIYINAAADSTLCIKDTGIGIAPEDMPRIFEKGYTGCNGRYDKCASGIGLYLCRRICRNLGHTINFESSPGKGTLVSLGFSQTKCDSE